MELPFELAKRHKDRTKYNWNRKGLIASEEEIESIYYMYIYTSTCELCNKEFTKSNERQMKHNDQTGKFKNIVCRSCKMLKNHIMIKPNIDYYKLLYFTNKWKTENLINA